MHPTQNLKNHSRMVPLFHFGIFLLLLIAIVISIVNLCKCDCEHFMFNLLFLILSIALLLTTWFTRVFALKAQDRAIKAEENLRHFAMTGKLLPTQLKISQVIALRFAADEEWLSLMQQAIDKNLSSKEIKENIKNWRGDYYRV
jgi:Family of unknown function (DUF6526)